MNMIDRNKDACCWIPSIFFLIEYALFTAHVLSLITFLIKTVVCTIKVNISRYSAKVLTSRDLNEFTACDKQVRHLFTE